MYTIPGATERGKWTDHIAIQYDHNADQRDAGQSGTGAAREAAAIVHHTARQQVREL